MSATMTARADPEESQRALVALFQDRGYLRLPDRDRRASEPGRYKKGYEIRFVADSRKKLSLIRRLLKQVGLKPGKPFQKRSVWIQPVYGRDAVTEFQAWLKQFG
jgi:hypothetical protein